MIHSIELLSKKIQSYITDEVIKSSHQLTYLLPFTMVSAPPTQTNLTELGGAVLDAWVKKNIPSARERFEFVLDPLAEYLAGLHLLQKFADNQELWEKL